MKKYPLNIQFFAEDGNSDDLSVQNNNNETSQAHDGSVIDYEKIADILSKRGAQAQDSALKGYLKDQGVSAEEMDKAIKDYKAKIEADKQAKNKAQEEMALENKRLKNELQNISIDKKISEFASEVSAEKLPYLSKLVDRKDFINEKGELNDEAIKTAIEKVLEDFPGFKTQNNSTGFAKVGADGSNSKVTLDDQLKKNFGL